MTRGNGRQGNMVFTYRPAIFVTLSGHVPFIPPVHPGLHPTLVRDASAHVTVTVTSALETTMKYFELFWATESALQQQILAAMPAIYLQPLDDADRGFVDVITLHGLTHLRNTRPAEER